MMLYPIEVVQDVKVVDGGIWQLLVDLVYFAIKVALFLYVAYTVLFFVIGVFANRLSHVSVACQQEIKSALK